MTTSAQPRITARGHTLDTSPAAFGELRRSDDALDDQAELRSRLDADGYLYLPGYLDRDEVLAARHDVLCGLADLGGTRQGTDPAEAVPGERHRGGDLAKLARETPSLMRLLYSGRMIELYQRIFAEQVRHFDHTWLRAMPPGKATRPHMDSVFMNRGTLRLLTAWTPLGDINGTLGGVTILERSHTLNDVKDDYGMRDVDLYCSNHDDADEQAAHESMVWDGALSYDPVKLRADLGLRWLTTDYQAGDLLTFTIFTAHCGLDNNSDRLRLSTDSRYQPASEPADPRWVGANPTGHGSRSKRGMIC